MYSVCNNQITLAGLPHSDIPGSKLAYQLPEAFRRYPRPSSPVSAKASTVCPYSLDHISPSIHLEVRHRQDGKHGLPFLNCQRTYPPTPSSEWVVINNTGLPLPIALFSTTHYIQNPFSTAPQRPARALRGPSIPVVELTGLEPVTPCLQSRCSPN